MDSLVVLSELLKKIENISKEILREIHMIMSKLTSEDCDIVERILEETNNETLTASKALELAKDYSLSLLDDAETIIDEMPYFLIHDSKGFHINQNSEKCIFLLQVWHGDIYNEEGIKGMKELETDLKNQRDKIELENFINHIGQNKQ